MVARYTEVEAIYLEHKPTSNLEQKFKTCLIDLFAKILEYQVTAACHCKRNTFGKIRCTSGIVLILWHYHLVLERFLRAIPGLDAWNALLQEIEAKDSACKEFTQIFDSKGMSEPHYHGLDLELPSLLTWANRPKSSILWTTRHLRKTGQKDESNAWKSDQSIR